jgi:hypothetical protein
LIDIVQDLTRFFGMRLEKRLLFFAKFFCSLPACADTTAARRVVNCNPALLTSSEVEMEIRLRDQDIDFICEQLRKTPDAELIRHGKSLLNLSDPKTQHGSPNPAFVLQLKLAREEWRRRYPK